MTCRPLSKTSKTAGARPARSARAGLTGKTHEVDPLLCPECGSSMGIMAFIEEGVAISGRWPVIIQPGPDRLPFEEAWKFSADDLTEARCLLHCTGPHHTTYNDKERE